MPRHAFRFIALGLVVILQSSALDATNLTTLLSNSPFGSNTRSADPQTETSLEFRGVLTESGIAYFSIHEPATSRSAWVRLNEESSRDYTAKRYDWESRQLTIEYQGRDLVLSLAADSSPAPISTSVAAAPQPVVTKAPQPSVSEAQRLNNIAAEIKRRRALRQQAINRTKQNQ